MFKKVSKHLLLPVLISLPFGLKTFWKKAENLPVRKFKECPASAHEVFKGVEISVIVPAWHEEEYIERTIHSLVEHTPSNVLKEIIVVDDFSSVDINPVMQNFLKNDPKIANKVKLIKLKERKGLIYAKALGAFSASGSHLFFLDGHCRLEKDYMFHLLKTMANKADRIVVPVIAAIDSDWQFTTGKGIKMMFRWSFEFNWFEDEKKSDQVPVLSGGILLMNKKFFFESGGYDLKMLEWGGENIDQSIKTRLTGGDVKVSRQSVVGHLFQRNRPKNGVDPRRVQLNQNRAAYFWLDKSLFTFIDQNNRFDQFLQLDDVSFGLSLKNKIQKKNFDDAFKKVFLKEFYKFGLITEEEVQIFDVKSGLCLSTRYKHENRKRNQLDETLEIFLDFCEITSKFQRFLIGENRIYVAGFYKCLDRGGKRGKKNSPVILFGCDDAAEINKNQIFKFKDGKVYAMNWENKTNFQFGENSDFLCLSVADKKLHLGKCEKEGQLFDVIRP